MQTTDLRWQPYDPEPTPIYIDVQVALTSEGLYRARTKVAELGGQIFGGGYSAEEAAENVRAFAEQRAGQPVKIRRPKKAKK